MDFEQDPRFNGGTTPRQSLRTWLAKNERLLYAATVVLVIVFLGLSLLTVGGSLFSSGPGGLDGCIMNEAGEPMMGTAQVDKTQRPTSADGCFFFAELPPGKHNLTIVASGGSVRELDVEIISDQAVGLGTISMP